MFTCPRVVRLLVRSFRLIIVVVVNVILQIAQTPLSRDPSRALHHPSIARVISGWYEPQACNSTPPPLVPYTLGSLCCMYTNIQPRTCIQNPRLVSYIILQACSVQASACALIYTPQLQPMLCTVPFRLPVPPRSKMLSICNFLLYLCQLTCSTKRVYPW